MPRQTTIAVLIYYFKFMFNLGQRVVDIFLFEYDTELLIL